jgi:hypothetical protein
MVLLCLRVAQQYQADSLRVCLPGTQRKVVKIRAGYKSEELTNLEAAGPKKYTAGAGMIEISAGGNPALHLIAHSMAAPMLCCVDRT